MSEEEKLHHVASIHATLTALSVAVGMLEEQMKSVRDELRHHTTNGHNEMNAALQSVAEIKKDVSVLQGLVSQGKGAWWIVAKIAAGGGLVIGLLGWAADHFYHIFNKPPL